jgi:hypothetical protein
VIPSNVCKHHERVEEPHFNLVIVVVKSQGRYGTVLDSMKSRHLLMLDLFHR